ncbi:MAG: carbohydrate ABC transporter permease [Acutalibacter sp.]|nr:carbohydrate ABC transporter permease [Acutalibacter sp.]
MSDLSVSSGAAENVLNTGQTLGKRRRRRRTREDWVMDTIVTVVMLFVILVTVYPFYYVIIQAFNNGMDSTLGGMYFYPRRPTLDNFITLLSDASWGRALFVSVARTVVGTFLGVFVTSAVAYALSFENILFRGFYYKVYIFTMYFGGGIIPFYAVIKNLGLINTFWVYVIPGMLGVYYMLILVNFFQSIPRSLYESAWLDGAGDIRVFLQIALPLSKASLATVALFYAVGQWNSWMDSVYYITKDELRPMAYMMMQIVNKFSAAAAMDNAQSAGYAASAMESTTTSLQMAAMVLGVVPILAVYPFLQKYFVKGVMIGSVKG